MSCAETKLRERQRDNVVKDCQHPFAYNWWHGATEIILHNREIFLPGITLFHFIIFQFKNFYDYTIKSSQFVYLNNMILIIQTLTQANSCSVAIKASFKSWRRYVKFWLVYVQFFFPSFNNWTSSTLNCLFISYTCKLFELYEPFIPKGI